MNWNSFWMKANYFGSHALRTAVGFVAVYVMISVIPLIKDSGEFMKSGKNLLDTSQEEIRKTSEFLNSDPRGLKGTFSNVNAILVQVGLASNQLRIASEKQGRYWDKTADELQDSAERINRILASAEKASKQLDQLTADVDSTVVAVRERSIPSEVAATDALAKSVGVLSQDSHLLLEDSRKTMLELQGTIQVAREKMQELGSEAIMENVQLTSKNMELATANVAETTGYIRDAFKPTKKSFWRTAISSLIPIGIRALVPQNTRITNQPTVEVKK